MNMQRSTLTPIQKRTVEPSELAAILKAHEQFLARASNGKRASFASRNLAGLDLSNRMLSEADFTGAVLYGASLKFATLERTNLFCADLRNVDGRYANFSHTDMRGATLTNSNLSFAKLDKADLRVGRLGQMGADGVEKIVDRSSGGTGVDFSYCSLRGASLEKANLSGANFTGTNFTGATFKGARFQNATFEGAVLVDVDLRDLQVPPAALKSCLLPPTPEAITRVSQLLKMLDAHQLWVATHARSGACAALDGEDLRPLPAAIGKFPLTAISAKGAIAVGMDFSGTQLQGVDFEGADLRGTSFEGADLRGANFRNANLAHTKFMGADLTSLKLATGGAKPCQFAGAKVTEEQLAEAILDAGFKLGQPAPA
jgi:uncharacterized protein YjbI with pentapeptide repeats